MEKLLEGKTVLIVGAGGLLGSQLVLATLEQGSRVIATDINLASMKERLVDIKVNISSDMLILTSLDITNEQSVKQFFNELSHIDGAVNTTYPRNETYGAHFFDVSLESFNENLALHLGSAFLFSQQCAAYFKKNGHPFSLVNISSIYGVIAPKFEVYENVSMTMPVEYAAIKSASLHLSKYITAYINDSRFRINSVSPGGIFDHQPCAFLDAYKKNTLGRGMLGVDDVVGSILFLLSEQSNYIAGQNIIVDDGFSL